MFELKGIYTPVATPFENGKIAYDKLDKNLDFLLESKLEGIVVMGSNGEFVALREAEKEELIRFCCKKIKGRKKITVGVGGNCIDETLELSKLSEQEGADAALVITPYYYKGGMKDGILEQYYTELADKSPLPIILYNMPGNTGVNLSSAVQIKLSKHPNIVGVKDTGGSIGQISETINGVEPGFGVFAGNWSFFLPSLYMGASGATLALGNAAPNQCVELMELFAQGKHAEARELFFRLMPLNAAMTSQFGIGGLKAAIELIGLFGGEPRSPLRSADANAREVVKAALVKAGIEIKG